MTEKLGVLLISWVALEELEWPQQIKSNTSYKRQDGRGTNLRPRWV
ncbi:hypothetical protein [Streptococcus suis]|nr:hypothetical protein [Streptococcus suis]